MEALLRDPEIARFISPDPIHFTEQNPFSFNRYAYANNNPMKFVDPDGRDAIVITGGIRDRSLNLFGHIAMGVTSNGLFSHGNDTPLRSSVISYLQTQSQYRNQMVTILQTTSVQDAAMIRYFNKHPNSNDVSKLDNCAVRTNEALMSANIPVRGIPFPGGTARDVASFLGSTTYFIPQGRAIPAALLKSLPDFETPVK